MQTKRALRGRNEMTTTNPGADARENIVCNVPPGDRQAIVDEANDARRYGYREDDGGKRYWYRPGVGGWWSADRKLWPGASFRRRNDLTDDDLAQRKGER